MVRGLRQLAVHWRLLLKNRFRRWEPEGSIPLLQVLHNAVPEAEFILWGAQDDSYSRIHGTNESVDIHELERVIVAQSLFLQLMSKRR